MQDPSEPSSRLKELTDKARDAITVKRVYGDPIERDGLTIIPVARVSGGAGGGGGGHFVEDQSDGGQGFGFGIKARPVGAFIVKDGTVTWHPAIDVTRIITVVCCVAVSYFLGGWRSGRRK